MTDCTAYSLGGASLLSPFSSNLMKADKLDFLANKSLSELKGLAAELKLEPNGDRRLKSTWFDLSIEYRCPGIKKRAAKLRDLAGAERLRLLLEQERHPTIARSENSPGAALVQEPIEKSLDVDRARNAYRVTYRKIPGCRSRPQCLSNSPIWNLHSHSKCATPGAKSETAGTCAIAT
jgi:hypothetical protein